MQMTGGGPLPDEIGDDLVRKGVPLVSILGGTEFALATIIRGGSKDPHEWNWFEIARDLNTRMVLRSENNEAPFYELVFLVCASLLLRKLSPL